MKPVRKILIGLCLASVLLSTDLAQLTQAAGASLYPSPTTGSKYVGEKFHVFIYVGADQSVNTFDVYVSVSNFTVTGISVAGSICKLYPSSPSYSPTSAHFQCGLPTPGYTGGAGYIGAVIVKGNSPGTAKLSIASGSKVLANDGFGTNILSSLGTATFNILPPPTAAPSVTSSTHPDSDKWYKNKDVSLSWSGAGSEFSYQFDQSADTIPDTVSEGTEKAKTYKEVADGLWYFHVRVKGSGGWSATTSFRVQIDSTPPEPFTPEADPKKDAEKRPIISFVTADATSGIDHYEVKIDNGVWVTALSPYQIPKIASGKHTIYVKAIDKAGNERIGQVEVGVKEIPAPIVTKPSDGSFIPYTPSLQIAGRSEANFQVEIYLDDKKIATVKTDKNGNFTYTHKNLLTAGKHTIYAIALNPDGIESPKSNVVNFTLDPRAFDLAGLTVPGIIVYSFLFGLIIILVIIFVFFILRSRRYRKKLKEIFEGLEEEVEEDLSEEKASDKAKEKVEKDFEETEKEL
ncbi:MAG: hypothetical protein A2126_00585 [Candidatus Woykebacteria bacterium GWB1_45_5]|uniref:Bacterial Ig-like domain-containing protein n=2 Tax=Candidatus Woykeibacteriota TaxID=1817899 RepID=A0A1G1W3H6_9BACT|nr:MAG: hypothetical protein A2113_03510 [Candidatus Woykebacteria bacterium GWA1_44_8]OGY24611.1 MAG: hypothetical protein A2126_00585 [Candidatus Woykebacteria bacterium GWB1_45_5]